MWEGAGCACVCWEGAGCGRVCWEGAGCGRVCWEGAGCGRVCWEGAGCGRVLGVGGCWVWEGVLGGCWVWEGAGCACVRRRLRQNDTNISEIYIGHPIYISDVRYIFQTSDIPALALPLALALAEVRYCILDVGYRYRMSDIDFGNIGVILPQTAPHMYVCVGRVLGVHVCVGRVLDVHVCTLGVHVCVGRVLDVHVCAGGCWVCHGCDS